MVNRENNPQDDLSGIIAEKLYAYTEIGLELAAQSVDILKDTIAQVTRKLEGSIQRYESRDYQDKDVMRSLTQQLESIKGNYELMPTKLEEDILTLQDGSFTITLFGRTEAGKSTLMNVLTHGDGSQIGKGAQRTTRDVRSYSYRGLNVVDVPGIAAVGGMEDEELAFDHARRSDLIIFLILGDAQESEARCLARIKELGKPVMLLLNVHVGITNESGFDELDLEDFEYDMQDEFDRQHLEAIRRSLIDYGPKYGQDWSHIPCAYVHLKSAFMAQKDELSEFSERLYQLSHFDDAVRLIEDEVCRSGGYFRLKSYSDAVAVPLIEILEELFDQSAANSRQGRVLIHAKKELKRWTEEYSERSKARIDAFIAEARDDLKSEAEIFAEDNYNNRKATQAWDAILKSRQLELRATELMEDLYRECEDKLSDMRREIEFDTKMERFAPRGMRLKAHAVIDLRKAWNWGTTILAGALTLGGVFITPQLYVAGFAVGAAGEIGNRLFGFDRLRDNARRKMRDQLYDSIDQQTRQLKSQMLRRLNDQVVGGCLEYTCREIGDVVGALFDLSDVQRNLAIQINSQLRHLNRATINEALAYLGYQGHERCFREIARIPGVTTAIVLEDGTKLPRKMKRDVGHLLDESMRYVFHTDNARILLSRVIGRDCSRSRISIENINDAPRIAHISGFDNLSKGVLTGVRLGEQVTELVIME